MLLDYYHRFWDGDGVSSDTGANQQPFAWGYELKGGRWLFTRHAGWKKRLPIGGLKFDRRRRRS